MEMARSLIPSECSEWTDHNPSDTGIILLELFAWLTDLLLYQVNQVPDKSYEVFLQLLKGDAKFSAKQNGESVDPQALQKATQEAILTLRQRYRAVTARDYEILVMENFNVKVNRVKAFANSNLTVKPQPTEPVTGHKPTDTGHISLVVMPQGAQNPFVVPDQTFKDEIFKFLDDRRLLGTKHHVVYPDYVQISVSAKLHLEPGRVFDQVKTICINQLAQFFHPLSSGKDQQGWPFGRSVYISEIYQQLDQVEGVDYVQDLRINNGEESISLLPHQLVQFEQKSNITSVEGKS
ncbi:baseplate protein J [Stenomitos frigidus]|uniref:baseplate protein J n=1 Tax=Stenomitos frigidus TaxID=1886765 RepID=UPI001C63A32B|nr:baseplate protein J [Stenomitos frigidus]